MRQHRDRLFTPSILVTSMIALLSISNAMAQEADSATQADDNVAPETMEEVVVYGIRRSLETALEEKRERTNLIEVINAEDIGKLPDENLAEVLENIPGVQISRSAGIGSSVSVRGSTSNNRVGHWFRAHSTCFTILVRRKRSC